MSNPPGGVTPDAPVDDLLPETQRVLPGPNTKAQRVAALLGTKLLDSPVEPAFDRLTALARTVLGVPVALVSLVDRERQFFKSAIGLPTPWSETRETPLSHSFCQYVADSAQPLVVADARQNAVVRENRAVADLGVIAYLGVPLRAVTGEAIGSLCAIDAKPRAWTEGDLATLTTLAEAVTSEIALRAHLQERRVAEDALRQREAHAMLLAELSERTRDLDSPEEVMAIVVRTVGPFMPAARCAYAEIEGDGETLAVRHDFGASDVKAFVERFTLSNFGKQVGGQLKAGRLTVIHDAPSDPIDQPLKDALGGFGVRSVICCPLIREGSLRAMLAVYSSLPHEWSEAECRLITEVAERSWSYIENARAARLLHRTELRLRHALSAADIGSWEHNLTTRTSTRDANLNRMFGLATTDTTVPFGKTGPLIHPDDMPVIAAAWEKARATRGAFIVEFRLTPPGGTMRWFREHGIFVTPDQDGDDVVAGITRDITQEREIERVLHEAKDAAEGANAAKDRFLAVLSHELRTPLTPVLMTLVSMETARNTPEGLRDDLRMMRRNIELETKLIDDLLDVSRVTTGKLALSFQPIELQEKVRHVCDSCRPQFQEKGIRLTVEQDAAVGMISADSARLQQVLWNVLKNAAKFTPAGGRVTVRTSAVGNDRVRVEVRDSGIGIPADVLPKIFNAFEQGEGEITRQFGGLGLGLAISKAIVEMHRGTIVAGSDGPNRGSVFTMEFPTCSAALPDGAPVPQQSKTAPGALRLLVVEDHPDTARILARLLGTYGHAVKTANTIAAALELAGQQKFDLVISDVGLPDGSGYDLMRTLRDTHAMRGIAMSGYGMEDDLRKSREAGFCEHLVKPLDFAELERTIRRVAELGA
jgi:signal transduction histidine kinase/CheY-like chemotaxis protein